MATIRMGNLAWIWLALPGLISGCFKLVVGEARSDAGATMRAAAVSRSAAVSGAADASAPAWPPVVCSGPGSANGTCDVLYVSDAGAPLDASVDRSSVVAADPNPCGPGFPVRGQTQVTCDCSGTGYVGLFCDQRAQACDEEDAGSCDAGHAVSIDTRCNTTCVVLDDSSVRCWGQNNQGQLGDGTMTQPTRPVAVRDLNGVQQVGVGCNLVCALVNDGTVRCWGDRELGDGTGNPSSVPVKVQDVSSATQIAVGDNHACARLQSGAVRCWGINSDGQLGDGTDNFPLGSVAASGLSHVARVAAGFALSYAWLDDGRLFGWGYNSGDVHLLGADNTGDQDVPIALTRIGSVKQLALGYFHDCALRADGTVDCWGYNHDGQLGRVTPDTTSTYLTPAPVTDLTGVQTLGSGFQHTCALMSDGRARCWGDNDYGQLGDGTQTDRITPVEVSGLRDVLQIAGGERHTCAVLIEGSVYCWGDNHYGQLGNGSNDASSLPTRVRGF